MSYLESPCRSAAEPLAAHPLISPITSTDRELYRVFFAADNRDACDGNSWTYITQACRGLGAGLGLKYHDQDRLYSIGVHCGHYVLVRPLGRIDDQTVSLLQTMREASGLPVFVKKLFPEQERTLRSLADFVEAVQCPAGETQPQPGAYPWDPVAYADDDTFPEIILSTAVSGELLPLQYDSGRPRRGHKKFQQMIRRFERDGHELELTAYRPQDASRVRNFLVNYFGPARAESVEAYENMLLQVPPQCGLGEVFAFVGCVDGGAEPVAFVCAERLDQGSAGVYATIASRTIRGLVQATYARIMRLLYENGIERINLGGSEHLQLDAFKHRLGPAEVRRMGMLVYGAR